MRIFGFEITRTKAADAAATAAVVDSRTGWWPLIRESFTGAWQRNVDCDSHATQLAFSAVYASCTTIAADIGKLPIRLMVLRYKGSRNYWRPFESAAETALLRKPNHFQTRSQFIESIVLSRLIHGNAYVLKGRDNRGFINSLYVLDPTRVTVLVGVDGSVFYRLKRDDLSGVGEGQSVDVTVPASEILHNRAVCLHHPLVGVSPIFACGWSATLGNRIQRNSATFFSNGSRPSGLLIAPTRISEQSAAALKETWDTNFGGSNVGKVAVLGDGLKFEPMAMSSIDAQLIEQLKWTVEDVARCYRVPLYMLAAGQQPTFNNIESLQRMYYSQTLQAIIESLELDFDKAFELDQANFRMEFDTAELLRMDAATRFDAWQKAINGGWMAPNEVREMEDLPSVEGGDTPYLQQQNWSLAALNRRDESADPAGDDPADGEVDTVLHFSRYFSNTLRRLQGQ